MPFEARISRWQLALRLLVGLPVMALGVAIFWPRPDEDGIHQMLGWVMIVCFALILIEFVRRLVAGGVELRVDATGIYTRRWSRQTIPWSVIGRVSPVGMGITRFASLMVNDTRACPPTTLSGKLSSLARKGYGHTKVNVTSTDASLDALMAAIRRFGPATLTV